MSSECACFILKIIFGNDNRKVKLESILSTICNDTLEDTSQIKLN